jgi:hypothetical protein
MENLTTPEKIARLRLKHQPYFEKIGIPDALFIPKTVYGTPPEVVIFPSEFKKEKDIYVEKTSRDYVSEDPLRALYKLKFKPDYDGLYRATAFGTDCKYHVPFSEFERIIVEEPKVIIDFGLNDPDNDAPISELMIRDIAAILWKKPVSQKKWLNTLISNQKQNTP